MVLTVFIFWENLAKIIAIDFHASLWMTKLIIPNLNWINSVKNSYMQHIVQA
jgi:hypothetical protein